MTHAFADRLRGALWHTAQRLAHGHRLFYYRHILGLLARSGCTTFLDLGCGFGTIVEAIRLQGTLARYHGMDIDAHRVALAQKRHAGPDVTFALGDVMELPIDGQFECLLLIGLAHHVPDDTFLRYLDRLRPHVTRYVLTLDPLAGRTAWERFYWAALEDGRYPRSPEDHAGLLARAGLTPEAVEITRQHLGFFDFWAGLYRI